MERPPAFPATSVRLGGASQGGAASVLPQPLRRARRKPSNRGPGRTDRSVGSTTGHLPAPGPFGGRVARTADRATRLACRGATAHGMALGRGSALDLCMLEAPLPVSTADRLAHQATAVAMQGYR